MLQRTSKIKEFWKFNEKEFIDDMHDMHWHEVKKFDAIDETCHERPCLIMFTINMSLIKTCASELSTWHLGHKGISWFVNVTSKQNSYYMQRSTNQIIQMTFRNFGSDFASKFKTDYCSRACRYQLPDSAFCRYQVVCK